MIRRLALLTLALGLLSGCLGYPLRCSPSWFFRCGKPSRPPSTKRATAPKPPTPAEVASREEGTDA